MNNIMALWKVPNKGQFMIDHLSDSSFFSEVSSMSRERRQQLARELIETRFSYNFHELLDRLTYANIDLKGAEYLRAGHQDFLGFLVQAFILHIDGHQISTLSSFNHYQPSKEVVDVITKIKFTIGCRDVFEGHALMDNFAPNMMAGVFYPLWLIQETNDKRALQMAIAFESQKGQKTVQNAWIYSRFMDYLPDTNNTAKRISLFEKYHADATALLDFVALQPRHMPKVRLFFSTVKVVVDEKNHYVPPEMARAVKAIQANMNRDPGLIVTWLMLEREAMAQLTMPQKLSPIVRDFYQLILDRRDLPVLNNVFEPPHLESPNNWVI